MAGPPPFRVLFVCTGNICRSPTGERLLRHTLRERLGDGADAFDVTSAGIGALVGEPIQDHAAALLADHGVDTDGFAARQLDRDLVGADLVLAMTREHRAAAATLDPTIIPRLFTLREFVRLADAAVAEVDAGAPVERAAALAGAAARQRGRVRPERPADDDVPDPYGRSAEAYRLPFELIDDAVTRISDMITGKGEQ